MPWPSPYCHVNIKLMKIRTGRFRVSVSDVYFTHYINKVACNLKKSQPNRVSKTNTAKQNRFGSKTKHLTSRLGANSQRHSCWYLSLIQTAKCGQGYCLTKEDPETGLIRTLLSHNRGPRDRTKPNASVSQQRTQRQD